MSLYDLRPQRLDVLIVAGNDFSMALEWIDRITQDSIDLSGFTLSTLITLQDGTTLAFDSSESNLLGGIIVLQLSDATTATLDAQLATWYLELTDSNGYKRTYVNGQFVLSGRNDLRTTAPPTVSDSMLFVTMPPAQEVVITVTSGLDAGGGGGGGSSFLTDVQRDITGTVYWYYGGLTPTGAWVIHRYKIDVYPSVRTTATVSNNSSYTTLSTAWAARGSLTYA